MTVGRHGSDSSSIGLPTKRISGIPRRWKLTTRGTRGVVLIASGAEIEPASPNEQPLERFGGKGPAEQEALSEVAPQGP